MLIHMSIRPACRAPFWMLAHTSGPGSRVCYNTYTCIPRYYQGHRAVSDDLLRELSLDEVIGRCRDEAIQDRQRETGACFELFRRALEAHEQVAWAAIERQYRQLMLGWVYAYKSVTFTPEEAENTVREAYERFWRTLTTRSVLVAQFGHVGALLKYLNQCVITTILDQQRRAQRMARLMERMQAAAAGALAHGSPEETALEGLDRAEKIQQVRQWVRAHVSDPQEQRLLYLSYECELTPAEIAQQYPHEFANAQAVRRIKERVLKRARRALAETILEESGGVEENPDERR